LPNRILAKNVTDFGIVKITFAQKKPATKNGKNRLFLKRMQPSHINDVKSVMVFEQGCQMVYFQTKKKQIWLKFARP
jgi:hypothetical protein